MDGPAIAGWSAAFGTVGTFLIKSYFDDRRIRRELEAAERRRIADREQDRLDRKAAAELTAAHRDLMAGKVDAMVEKIDVNTVVSTVAAEKADQIQRTTQALEKQTNGLNASLLTLTAADSFRRGQVEEKLKQAEKIES